MYFWFFFPTGLNIECQRRPVLSWSVVALLVGVFAWSTWWPDRLPLHPWDLVFYAGDSHPWTAATALLMHADWLHLAGNLVYLVIFLPAIEDRLGRVGLVLLLVATGVGGNLCHAVAAWHGWFGQGGLGILGASGAISGLLGFALVRLNHARVNVAYWVFAPLQGQNRAGRQELAMPVAVLTWLVLQIVNALLAGESGSTVSYPAHLGGFVVGCTLAFMLGGARDNRAEASLAAARNHLGNGRAWPAVGAYTEYLQQAPDDLSARLEQARAMMAAETGQQAQEAYREVYRRAIAEARWDRALDTLEEGRRLLPGLGLPIDDLASAAQQADRSGRTTLAIALYTDLVKYATGHPAVDRGWVRLVMLLHAAGTRDEEVAACLASARRHLPAGAWRDYLDREFSSSIASHADDVPAVAGPPRGRES